jgi:CheY-like chemotaxis protein
LTRQLLTYARRQLSIPAELDLNVLIENVVGMLRRLIGTHISMVWTPGAELWTVRMDPVQFDQLLTNLCVNARDAIDDTGTVRVATANVVIDEAFTARHSGARTGEFVRVTVSDDGSGIDATTLAHIFEPFFTTKPVGVGTGLGLSMVVGIVAQNNGFITVDSAIGQGTTFAIHLPRYVGDAASQQARGTSAPSTPGAETILVVEDEPAILSLVVRTLSGLGYKVLGANGPRHALTISAEHDGVIDLMLTDVKMPDMNGRDLSVALQKDRPDMRVLFMSGYPAEVIAKRGVLDEGLQFLAKPFLVKDLVGKIREILK